MAIRIVYGEIKRQANLSKHGLDFAELDHDFFLNATVEPARDGRSLAIGEFKGMLVIAVIFRPLGSEAFSVISMRPAGANERKLFNA